MRGGKSPEIENRGIPDCPKFSYIMGMSTIKEKPGKSRTTAKKAKVLPKVRVLKKYALPDGTRPEDFFPGWQEAGASLPEVYFAVEYLSNGFDAGKAYLEVFPKESPRRAAICGQGYLRRPTVQKILAEYTTAWLRGRVSFLEKEILDTTMARALYDPAMFLNPDGTAAFSSWDDIPECYRRCIEGIDVKFWGKDADRQSITFNLANRSEALVQLTKLLTCIKQGMEGDAARGPGISQDTELLLSTMFSQGRRVDMRSPAEIRRDNAAGVIPGASQEIPSTVITGVG